MDNFQKRRLQGEDIKCLDLSCLGLSDLPEDLFDNVEGLEELILGDFAIDYDKDQIISNLNGTPNSFTQLPKAILRVKNLKKLYLKNLRIHDFSILNDFKDNLEVLDCSYTGIHDIAFLSGFSRLRVLDCRGNNIEDISFLRNLTELEILMCQANQISELSSLTSLSNLRILDCSSMNTDLLHDLSPLKKLENLEQLNCAENSMIDDLIPLNSSYKLKSLICHHTGIKHLLPISQLKNLENLDLSQTKVNNQEFQKVNWSHFQKLKYFNLSQTSIIDLRPLKSMIERGVKVILNEVSSSDSDPFSTDQGGIFVRGCSIETPPIETIEQGSDQIIDFFHKLSTNKKNKYLEAKIVLLGEPSVGKTSFASKFKNINSELLYASERKWSGVSINSVMINTTSQEAIKVNIWDFASQFLYLNIHKFFLTKRTTWIIIFKDHLDLSRLMYWLQVAKQYGEDSPVCILINQFENAPRPDLSYLRSNHFANLIDISYANLDTLAELKGGVAKIKRVNFQDTNKLFNKIKNRISELPHIGTTYPKSWLDIRNKLESLDKNFISVEDFFSVCEQFKISGKNRNDLVEYLRDTGVIVYMETNMSLRKVVILSIEWLINGILLALNNPKLQEENKQGKFARTDINTIWADSVYFEQAEIFLELMIHFELCFQTSKVDYFIIPQLLSASPPASFKVFTALEESGNKLSTVRYHYEFAPIDLFAKFLVRVHHLVDEQQNAIWREGAILVFGGTKALVVEEKLRNYAISIKAFGHESKAFTRMIVGYLDEVNQKFPNIKVEKLVPCNCEKCQYSETKTHYDYFELEDRLKHGIHDISCKVNNYRRVLIQPLLDAYGSGETFENNLTDEHLEQLLDLIDSDMLAAFDLLDKLNWGNHKGTYNDKKAEWIDPGVGFNKSVFRSQLKTLLKTLFT